MDAFARFKASIVDAVGRLDLLAEYRRLMAAAGGAASGDATPPGVPSVDWRRLCQDVSATWLPHGAPAAAAVVLAERLAGDMLAAVRAVGDDVGGDEWRRLRPGIVERLGELERAESELNAPRRAALEALRASRLLFVSAPPPGPASATPAPATPAPVSPSPVPPAPPPKPKPVTPSVEAVEPLPVTPAVARDNKPASTDDERLAGIVRRLSDNACRVASYLRAEGATSYRTVRNRQRIADALSLSVDDVNAVRDELDAAGVPFESKGGRNGGWWLTPDGVRVAEIVAREPPPTTAAKAGNGTKPGVNRG